MSSSQEFPPDKWFEVLFGFKEVPRDVAKHFQLQEFPDHVQITSKDNNKSYNAGNFQIRSCTSFSIGDGEGQLKKRGNGTLNLIHGYGFDSEKFELIDVLSSQSLPQWNGATFQAASNFNCLEFVSSSQTASSGITNYFYDTTQGPYCAIGAGPAILYRNYFIKHHGKVGQLEKEINLLERTPLKIKGGYPLIHDPKELESLDFDWDNLDNWPVGVHRNCEVTMTRGDRGFKLAPPNQIVHHVYAAAFNFYGSVRQCDFTINLSRKLLAAEYRATILAAWENSQLFPGLPGSNVCILTQLGGGVFGNPKEIICEAIESCMDIIVDSGLTVYVCCFSDSSFKDVNSILGKYVKETGGTILETK